jgi:hypothetical protein
VSRTIERWPPSRSTSRTFRIDTLSLASDPFPRLIEGADQLIRMPIESGLELFTGLHAIVEILPTLPRNRCPRWGRITHTGGN